MASRDGESLTRAHGLLRQAGCLPGTLQRELLDIATVELARRRELRARIEVNTKQVRVLVRIRPLGGARWCPNGRARLGTAVGRAPRRQGRYGLTQRDGELTRMPADVAASGE